MTDLPATPVRRPRGALKSEVLSLLLGADAPLTANEIRSGFVGSEPALTTVLTVLDRLRRSGQVERLAPTSPSATGELLFVAVRDESASVAQGMLERLLRSSDRTGALLSFAGSLEGSDLDVLRAALGADAGAVLDPAGPASSPNAEG